MINFSIGIRSYDCIKFIYSIMQSRLNMRPRFYHRIFCTTLTVVFKKKHNYHTNKIFKNCFICLECEIIVFFILPVTKCELKIKGFNELL